MLMKLIHKSILAPASRAALQHRGSDALQMLEPKWGCGVCMRAVGPAWGPEDCTSRPNAGVFHADSRMQQSGYSTDVTQLFD